MEERIAKIVPWPRLRSQEEQSLTLALCREDTTFATYGVMARPWLLLFVLVLFGIREFDLRLQHRCANFGPSVFYIGWIHVVFYENLEKARREFDSMLPIFDVILNQRPHLEKQLTSGSPAHPLVFS